MSGHRSHIPTNIWINRSLAFYRLLLGIYPPAFRREYGPQMLQVFGDCCRAYFNENKLAGLLSLWGLALLDLLQSAIEQHFRRETDMNKQKYIRLSGWGLALGAISVLIGFNASNRPSTYEPYNLQSSPFDPWIYWSGQFLIVTGLLLLTAGMYGLYLRFKSRTAAAARISLVVGVLAGIGMSLAAITSVAADLLNLEVSWDDGWFIFIYSLGIYFASLVGFAIFAQASSDRPRWLPLAFLVGLLPPTFILLSNFWQGPEWLGNVILTVSLLGLGAIGGLVSMSQPADHPVTQ